MKILNELMYFCNKIYDRVVDKYLHVETHKCKILEEHDNVINFMYEPSPYRVLRAMFIKNSLEKEDCLIDFGCGKGRVLIMAVEYGCKNIYGLDISRYLLQCANKNLKRSKQKHNDIMFELICMDARKYKFNPKINKIFFFNPFHLRVYIHVFNALIQSIDEQPRIVKVYFYKPQISTIEYFEQLEKFKIIDKDAKNSIYVYSN